MYIFDTNKNKVNKRLYRKSLSLLHTPETQVLSSVNNFLHILHFFKKWMEGPKEQRKEEWKGGKEGGRDGRREAGKEGRKGENHI